VKTVMGFNFLKLLGNFWILIAPNLRYIKKKILYDTLRERNSRQRFFFPRIHSSRRRKVGRWFWIILWAAWLLTKLKACFPAFYSTTQSYDRIMKVRQDHEGLHVDNKYNTRTRFCHLCSNHLEPLRWQVFTNQLGLL